MVSQEIQDLQVQRVTGAFQEAQDEMVYQEYQERKVTFCQIVIRYNNICLKFDCT